MQTQTASTPGRIAQPLGQQALAAACGALLILAAGTGIGVEIGRGLGRTSGAPAVAQASGQRFVFARWGGARLALAHTAMVATSDYVQTASTTKPQRVGLRAACWRLCPPRS